MRKSQRKRMRKATSSHCVKVYKKSVLALKHTTTIVFV